MIAVESSVARIEAALKKMSRRALARAANIVPANLREAGTPDWNPTRRTLRALEEAIEAGVAGEKAHRESARPNSRRAG